MRRIFRGLVAVAPVVLAVAAAMACESEEAPCRVDTDCPEGTICREERCGPVDSDAATIDVAPPPACSVEGATCTLPHECCTGICTDGRCAPSTPPPPTTCRGSLELCQDDCCAGLTCTGGVCR